MTRIIAIVEGKSVVAFLEIGTAIFAGIKNPDAFVFQVFLGRDKERGRARVYQIVRCVGDGHLVLMSEQIIEVIVCLVEALREVTEVKFDRSHVWCLKHSLLGPRVKAAT
jgi:hypothetical protein